MTTFLNNKRVTDSIRHTAVQIYIGDISAIIRLRISTDRATWERHGNKNGNEPVYFHRERNETGRNVRRSEREKTPSYRDDFGRGGEIGPKNNPRWTLVNPRETGVERYKSCAVDAKWFRSFPFVVMTIKGVKPLLNLNLTVDTSVCLFPSRGCFKPGQWISRKLDRKEKDVSRNDIQANDSTVTNGRVAPISFPLPFEESNERELAVLKFRAGPLYPPLSPDEKSDSVLAVLHVFSIVSTCHRISSRP